MQQVVGLVFFFKWEIYTHENSERKTKCCHYVAEVTRSKSKFVTVLKCTQLYNYFHKMSECGRYFCTKLRNLVQYQIKFPKL
jgi:hypothetical protein